MTQYNLSRVVHLRLYLHHSEFLRTRCYFYYVRIRKTIEFREGALSFSHDHVHGFALLNLNTSSINEQNQHIRSLNVSGLLPQMRNLLVLSSEITNGHNWLLSSCACNATHRATAHAPDICHIPTAFSCMRRLPSNTSERSTFTSCVCSLMSEEMGFVVKLFAALITFMRLHSRVLPLMHKKSRPVVKVLTTFFTLMRLIPVVCSLVDN